MDLTQVFIVAITFTASYKTIELLVRRKERLRIIEKMNPGDEAIKLPKEQEMNFGRYTSLRAGSLLCGLGAGLLLGYIITLSAYVNLETTGDISISYYEVKSVIMGGSVLFCGGLGLLISFIVERIMRKKS